MSTTILSRLITDRTPEDAALAGRLGQTGWENMTPAEKAAWEAGLKGCYNASDLNRVGYAVQFLAEEFARAGYVVKVAPKLDWTEADLPKAGQMARYLGDVAALRDKLYGDVALPETMERLDWDGANRLELALAQAGKHLEQMRAAYVYAGDVYGGEL